MKKLIGYYIILLFTISIPPITACTICYGKECFKLSSVIMVVWLMWCLLFGAIWCLSVLLNSIPLDEDIHITDDWKLDIKLWYILVNLCLIVSAVCGTYSSMEVHQQFTNPDITDVFLVFVESVVFSIFFAIIIVCLVFVMVIMFNYIRLILTDLNNKSDGEHIRV